MKNQKYFYTLFFLCKHLWNFRLLICMLFVFSILTFNCILTYLQFFSSIFTYFTETEHLKNYEKIFYFTIKIFFCYGDIQIFVLSSPPFFHRLAINYFIVEAD